MRTYFLKRAGVVIVLAAVSLNASAQLTLRLEPEAEDLGTSSMPARIGHTKSSRGSGVATQLAISYSITKAVNSGNFIYEPYVALAINDNPAIFTDKKSFEVGVKSVYGDLSLGTAWLLDASASRARDVAATTSSAELTLSAEPVAKWLKLGFGYTSGQWGLFVRPKLKMYYINTMATDDSAKAPKGTATGLSSELAFDLFLPFSDRAKITVSSVYARDQSVSGDRTKDDYKKAKAQIEYLFYSAADPPKGKALFSLLLERSIGRDALSTATEKKSSTGVYIGAKL